LRRLPPASVRMPSEHHPNTKFGCRRRARMRLGRVGYSVLQDRGAMEGCGAREDCLPSWCSPSDRSLLWITLVLSGAEFARRRDKLQLIAPYRPSTVTIIADAAKNIPSVPATCWNTKLYSSPLCSCGVLIALKAVAGWFSPSRGSSTERHIRLQWTSDMAIAAANRLSARNP